MTEPIWINLRVLWEALMIGKSMSMVDYRGFVMRIAFIRHLRPEMPIITF